MTVYQDAKGNERTCEVDIESAERVRRNCGVNLFDLVEVGNVCQDMGKALKVVYELQNLRGKETFAEWDRAHRGDGYANATDAFVAALCDFFPSRLANQIRNRQAMLSAAIETVMTEISGETFGDSLALLESIPVR